MGELNFVLTTISNIQVSIFRLHMRVEYTSVTASAAASKKRKSFRIIN